ncbi:ABC transporter permease [Nocardioides alcanivorans]|uniref:ABC transporter permease n=1 Tax=Nocardioides alcanivorans TaxID=2897352 RepID=UPI0028A09A72|nr:ABC transporter permease subunit [Nocardioides alcanivorans]
MSAVLNADVLNAEKVHGVPRIPLGDKIVEGVDWIIANFGDFLDRVGRNIEDTVNSFTDLLLTPAPLVMVAILALLAWLAKDWKFALGSVVGLVLVIGMDQWENTMATASLVVSATVVALVIGIPIGILAARFGKVSAVVKPVMDFMQTMPALVWLVPVVMLFGAGVHAGLVATVIFALAPGVRFTELGIRQVDAEVVEAGHAFGATPRQILREVQLPLAMPTVMAGVNQVIMLSLSMAVIAGMVGGGGLGGDVVGAIANLEVGLGFEAGLSVVVLAIFLDRITASAGSRRPGHGRLKTLRTKFSKGERQPAAA